MSFPARCDRLLVIGSLTPPATIPFSAPSPLRTASLDRIVEASRMVATIADVRDAAPLGDERDGAPALRLAVVKDPFKALGLAVAHLMGEAVPIDGRGGDSVALYGGDGDDVLNGAGGIGTLRGGEGANRFYFQFAPGARGLDTVTDFAAGVDKIYLFSGVFRPLGRDADGVGAFPRCASPCSKRGLDLSAQDFILY